MHAYTLAFIIVVALGASTWTAVAAANGVPGDTVSAVLRRASRDWWVLAYVWGLLAGHWFLGHPHAVTTPGADTRLVLWLSWAIFVLNAAHFRLDWPDVPVWGYALLLGLGTACGHFLWSQGGAHPLH